MRRVVVGCAVVLAVVSWSLPSASGRPSAPDRHQRRLQVLADLNHDRVDDLLERRLRTGGPEARHAVVVATDGSVSIADARGAAGPFAVSRRLAIIDGFSARLAPGQIRTLARTAGVLRIDLDVAVHATMDAARHDYGVDQARTTFGLSGAGVDVCILDTGVDATHEQLDSKTIAWRDFINGRLTPYDDHRHGTHVASIAVGDGVGGPQAARFGGVAPAAGLWAGKVLDAQGSGTESQIIAGIDWCATSPTVDVISMSLGTAFPSNGTDNLSLAANRAVTTYGKVVTVAAGNSGDSHDSIGSPGAASEAITVGASSSWSAAPGQANHSDGVFLAFFSSRGGSQTAGKPDIVAPGYRITAAEANTGGYATFSGTSMATPFAAGAAALTLEAAPAWTPQQLQAAIEGTAEDFGPAGKDKDWGAGLIDVAALAAQAEGASGPSTTFPTHVHVASSVPTGGSWTYPFDLTAGQLDVPIAGTVILATPCTLFFPGFGCLDSAWTPDLDVKLFDPNGVLLDISQCAYVAPATADPQVDSCGLGRQETVHSMPTVAGTYRISVYAYPVGTGQGGPFDLDLSTGPVGTTEPPPPPPPPPPPTLHVGDLDATSVWVNATTWRGTVTIRVHDGTDAPVAGVTVTGRWGANGSVTCTTGTNGACTISKQFKKSRASIAFNVLGLSKASYTYVAADNHDEVDADSSNGTRITVNRPA
jgi:serine protease AprX